MAKYQSPMYNFFWFHWNPDLPREGITEKNNKVREVWQHRKGKKRWNTDRKWWQINIFQLAYYLESKAKNVLSNLRWLQFSPCLTWVTILTFEVSIVDKRFYYLRGQQMKVMRERQGKQGSPPLPTFVTRMHNLSQLVILRNMFWREEQLPLKWLHMFI